MKSYAKFTAVILAASMLCACSKIADDPNYQSRPESVSSADNSEQNIDTYRPVEHIVIKQKFAKRYEAEKGAFNGIARNEEGELASTEQPGFVRLSDGQYVTQIATVTTSQYYRVVISARSEEGAVIKLQVGDVVEGFYYVQKSENTSESNAELSSEENASMPFSLYEVDNLYMSVGMNTIKFIVASGSADIDFIIVENSDVVSDSLYNVGNTCVSPNATQNTVELMKKFSENYGKTTFSAQNVSVGSNVEIDAVFNQTQRYPAIRASELALTLKDDNHSAEVMKTEFELAEEWNKKGGILAYSWHWYAPNSVRSTDAGSFNIDTVLNFSIDIADFAALDEEGVQFQLDNGFITQDAASLLEDIDRLAEALKPFNDKDIPIIFEPIPDGDSALFWWSGNAETYKKLWQITFERLVRYNKINNLIWVWNNSNFDFYPGDRYVDIIGQSFYEKSPSSFAGRFSAISSEPSTARKMLALTACDTLPDIDSMQRDNAMWLWTAIDSGDYTIDSSGNFSEKYTRSSALKQYYGNEICITRDELSEQ